MVAAIDGEFTVKELRTNPFTQLVPHNSHYAPIRFHTDDALEIFGVVTFTLKANR